MGTHTFEQFAKSVMSRLAPLSFAQREEMQVLINQGIDPVEARALVQSYVQKDAGFEESKHPRDHGKFSHGAGATSNKPPPPASPHLREAARQQRDAQAATARAQSARAIGDTDRAERHMAEARAHLDAAKAANDAHRETRQPQTPAKPAPSAETPSKNLVAQNHFQNADESLARAGRHMASADQAKAAGKDAEATAHLQQANNANANARRELTYEKQAHDAENRMREAKGKPALAHDDARHAKLTAQHEENRAKIVAAKPRSGEDKAQAAVSHTTAAEQSLGKARAAQTMGDTAQAQDHMRAAQRSADAAEREVRGPLQGNASEQNAQMQGKIRAAGVQRQLKEGVDDKHLVAARQAQSRAQAHDKASERHGIAGHTEQASHHASQAAHARHEAGHHLAEFGKLIADAADRSLEKSAGPRRAKKSDALTHAYLKAFYQSAETRLPKWQAGHIKGRARRSVEQARLKKDGLLMSDVHVPVPIGPKAPRGKWPKPVPQFRLLKSDAAEMAYVNQALNLQDPTYRLPQDDTDAEGHAGPDASVALEAHRLVQGMDMELAAGSADAEHARKTASRMLMDRPGYYDTVGATPDMLGDKGIMLDLGSGTSRAMGHIGIDLHPYDYGTVLYDLDLGIPFPDGCARAIRMTHSLHPILDAYGTQRSPLPLLLEVQRVLREGGQLYYEGPEPLYEKGDPWPVPGLALISDTSDATLTPNANAPVAQVFRRVPLRVPAFAGADALYAPAPQMPVDAAMALLAANASPAEVAMANLVAKHERPRVVPIVKADSEKQICYGEVLNPLTIDSQNDWLTAADIEKAAHDYMMTSRVIGSEHGEPIGASVVESFVAPQDLNFASPAGPVAVPKGTWLIGVKVTDPDEWAKVKSGEYSGFSVGGFGVREAGMPDAHAA